MSRSDWRARVEDILESIGNLQSFVEGMTYEEFTGDTKTVRAAAYEVMIIGEAARQIPKSIQSRYTRIPWAEMKGIRNVVVHEYFRVDLQILWQTITRDLPALVPILQEIAEERRSDTEATR